MMVNTGKDKGSALSLSQLTSRLATAISLAPGVNDVWVVGETSDLRLARGHCYMELLEKDASGTQLAKMRAMIWARDYSRIAREFEMMTGASLQSDLKIMARVRTTFHPLFGLSLTITDINPEYTAGDLVRRRNEILARLQREGVYDLNRTLPWPAPVLRIAVVSAVGAAGYGDFVRQLYSDPARFRFTIRLFEAPMQGSQTSPGVIDALERIAAEADSFDCVVIIRGGGAVADLVAFDDYNLASHVAQFPLPVIVGIGHDRDICALDYVAAISARTPTAAAETLVDMARRELGRLYELANGIARNASERTHQEATRLARIKGALPLMTRNIIERARMRVGEQAATRLADYSRVAITRRKDRLHAISETLEALSPEATLRRGFSITRIDGHAVILPEQLKPGEIIETTLAQGRVYSTVTKTIEK
ncbi:MAG: exodeoxyribonuclease VII large subunit [Muribaculaceae bacterium]|nr:exodeoxyribonuclease VII large subunit [Muribaculaceae bacterium]